MGFADIHNVSIAVPYQFNSCEWMVPAKVHAPDARPVWWEVAMVDCNLRLLDWKDATTSENGYSLGSGFEFMGWIAGNDFLFFIVAIVVNVINRHHDFVPVIRFLVKESLHD